ncbi:hypothetical protein ACMD2_04869 [Ananas comosus]|uniref:Uncharacterized protein n=1 Tax=Ananas comosus TaxID=4615 RepID=A0A199UMX9_ANACO|nr:hypothetical protein ACMD2_04869 [Ananas comosus]
MTRAEGSLNGDCSEVDPRARKASMSPFGILLLDYFEAAPSPNFDGRISPVRGLMGPPLPPDRGLISCLSSLIRGLYAFSEKRGLLRPLKSMVGVPLELVIFGLFMCLISPWLLVTMSSRISPLYSPHANVHLLQETYFGNIHKPVAKNEVKAYLYLLLGAVKRRRILSHNWFPGRRSSISFSISNTNSSTVREGKRANGEEQYCGQMVGEGWKGVNDSSRKL